MKNRLPVKKPCREQDPTSLDCGVLVCLWVECFAHDDEAAWEAAKTRDIDGYRAYIAHQFLKAGAFE